MRKIRKLNRTWNPEYIALAKSHIDEGLSMGSFAGRYLIPSDLWRMWYTRVPELKKLNREYKEKVYEQSRFKAGYLFRTGSVK